MINERAGVLNLGCEGMMLVGAMTAAVVSFHTGLAGAGVPAAMLAGALVALVFGIALVIFSGWRPGRAVVGALIFGGAEALIPRIQAMGFDVPIYLVGMLPYVLTLAVLIVPTVLRGERSPAPSGLLAQLPPAGSPLGRFRLCRTRPSPLSLTTAGLQPAPPRGRRRSGGPRSRPVASPSRTDSL